MDVAAHAKLKQDGFAQAILLILLLIANQFVAMVSKCQVKVEMMEIRQMGLDVNLIDQESSRDGTEVEEMKILKIHVTQTETTDL